MKKSRKEKFSSFFSLFWNFLTTFIISVIMIAAIAFIFFRVAGIQTFTIESGSMTPKYPINSVVLVKEVNPVNIEVGDVITFTSDANGTLVSHRVVDIDSQNHYFTTKGDANDSNDASPVKWENVVGKVVFGVPRIGALFDNISTYRTYWIIGLCVLLFISILANIIQRQRVRSRMKAAQAELEETEIDEDKPDEVKAEETDSTNNLP